MAGSQRIIDAHTHVLPQWAGLAVRVMDNAGIETSVTLGWQDAWGETLEETLKVFSRYPGRFLQLCNLNWQGIDDPGWGAREADSVEAAVEMGAGGLKIFKDLGLEVKTADGEFLRVDDRRLDPVFERAGSLGVPVLIHSADPVWFWRPLNDENFWKGVLQGGYEHWMYYRRKFPCREELLGERDNLAARHRNTVFVAPHMASLADDPLTFEETLEAHPNLYADFSARLPAMVRTPRRREIWREILLNHPDRILFGTDLIYLDRDVATGIQSQSFQKPEDIGRRPEPVEESYERTSVEYVRAHVEFLASDRVQEKAPFRRREGTFRLAGLGLPEEVVRKICRDTPKKVYHLS